MVFSHVALLSLLTKRRPVTSLGHSDHLSFGTLKYGPNILIILPQFLLCFYCFSLFIDVHCFRIVCLYQRRLELTSGTSAPGRYYLIAHRYLRSHLSSSSLFVPHHVHSLCRRLCTQTLSFLSHQPLFVPYTLLGLKQMSSYSSRCVYIVLLFSLTALPP